MSVPQQFLPLLQAPVLPAKVTEAQKISGRSLSIPVPSGIIGPVLDLDSMTTAGKLKRVLPLPSDASVISVSGKAYAIPCQPEEKYQQSVSLALSIQKYFSYLSYDCGRLSCSFLARSFNIRIRGIRERRVSLCCRFRSARYHLVARSRSSAIFGVS